MLHRYILVVKMGEETGVESVLQGICLRLYWWMCRHCRVLSAAILGLTAGMLVGKCGSLD